MFVPTYLGYQIFRSSIHQNYYTGILHGIFLPISAIGLMFIIHSLVKTIYPRDSQYMIVQRVEHTLYYILGGFSCCYASYDPFYGFITVLFYWFIMKKAVYAGPRLITGILLMAVSIGVMEFGGHWFLENLGSNLSHFPNSVIHTPLYGVRSVLGILNPNIITAY